MKGSNLAPNKLQQAAAGRWWPLSASAPWPPAPAQRQQQGFSLPSKVTSAGGLPGVPATMGPYKQQLSGTTKTALQQAVMPTDVMTGALSGPIPLPLPPLAVKTLAQLPLPLPVAPCCFHLLPCGCQVIATAEAAKAAQAAAIAALAAAT